MDSWRQKKEYFLLRILWKTFLVGKQSFPEFFVCCNILSLILFPSSMENISSIFVKVRRRKSLTKTFLLSISDNLQEISPEIISSPGKVFSLFGRLLFPLYQRRKLVFLVCCLFFVAFFSANKFEDCLSEIGHYCWKFLER